MELTELFLITASIFFLLGTVILIFVGLSLYKLFKTVERVKTHSEDVVKTLVQVRHATKTVVLDKLLHILR